MTFMILPTGQEYHLVGPAAVCDASRPVDVQATAHQLALINRFHGATTRPYSVAEHSLLCCEIAARCGASRSVQLAMLWHDAHESVTNDLSTPAKQAVNACGVLAGGTQSWHAFERPHAQRFRAAVGLLTVFTSRRALIREIDLMALATERRDLTAWREGVNAGWAVLGDDEPAEHRINPVEWIDLNAPERANVGWQEWRQRFIDRFSELRGAVASEVAA